MRHRQTDSVVHSRNSKKDLIGWFFRRMRPRYSPVLYLLEQRCTVGSDKGKPLIRCGFFRSHL